MSAEKAQHTPGPWHVLPTNDCVIESEKHGNIAITNLARKSVADAHLIASAPDLLALAKRYARQCEKCGGTGIASTCCGHYTITDHGRLGMEEGCCGHPDTDDCAVCRHIRLVIEKAEGGA